jgi:hypothetical protein
MSAMSGPPDAWNASLPVMRREYDTEMTLLFID